MNSLAKRVANLTRLSSSSSPFSAPVVGLQRSLRSLYSTESSNGGDDNELEDHYDDFLGEKPELELQGVAPRKGWGFRGVHKAIICGTVGNAPQQKLLRNGRTVTLFNVGTGGMFDQRLVGSKDLPKPAQWHRIAVHNDGLGAYAMQQLAKDSMVYVEGEIEVRVYNDSISGEVRNSPEICVRRDGKLRLITAVNRMSDISFDDITEEGLFS